ncbi:MAG TPA: orotidine 5'-phosphate decarboxylase / HUMPS family protein [Pyrinomonadaceae bacterium]|jgi:orotidine-5'-phosphate decarboxylase|nr:orotidine 5'-phosphate decarboxylase / HUMPS family protein [Pyrinomonadaceae bacterium]
MSAKGYFLSAQGGIVIAADVTSLDELRSLITLARTVPEVCAVKIGFSLAIRYGLSTVVRVIKGESDLPIIYDHQKAATDIPQMGVPFAEACQSAGVESVILFPHAGPQTLEQFVSAAFASSLIPIVGLVMTHPAYLESEGGYIIDTAPESICKTAANAGVINYVLPGTKTELIRSFSEGLLAPIRPAAILMPGIGTQGGRIDAAFKAAKGHRSFAIIGRAIYEATDPKAALEGFAGEVRSCVPI